ncbi:hypothetical protein HZC33_02815 [Candidatus Wolfebacteria bacterium]|nr:hypothetical protein [Candidatus Wolfebacteria bacterium]
MRLLRGELKVCEAGLSANSIFPLSVNYNRSIEDSIKVGKYDSVNSDIASEHFQSNETGEKKVAIELFHFNKEMDTNEALVELDKQGYRPITLKELLALGEEHPNLQREFPIVALGSVWQSPRGGRGCTFLGRYDLDRRLFLGWIVGRWDCLYRFGAVRK